MSEGKPLIGAARKRAEIREKYWKNWREELWIGDSKHNKGWALVPRTLDLIAVLIKKLKGKKDTDASRLYMNLWCRVWPDGVVQVSDERDLMFAGGYNPSRGMRTWRQGLSLLEKLGFILLVKPWGEDSGIAYICLRNPDMVVQELEEENLLPEGWKHAYERRMSEVGASRWAPTRRAKKKDIRPSIKRLVVVPSHN